MLGVLGVGFWYLGCRGRGGEEPAPKSVERAPEPPRPPHQGRREPQTPQGPVTRTVPGESGPGRLALVIDDLGRSLADLDPLERLKVPLSYSVLPFEEDTVPVVERLRKQNAEILCHLPMQPQNAENPGPGALLDDMPEEQLRQLAAAALDAVPGAVGANNHMGSRLSADAGAMRSVLSVLAERKLFFLDSRTSSRSVGYRTAVALGLPAAERQVFLDDDPDPEAIRQQFRRWLELSRTRGAAIAIGHPHPTTLQVLAEEIPSAQAAGYEFVPVSWLLDRPATAE